MLKTPWLPRIQAKYTGECGKKKVMSRFVSGTRRYEFPIASFSPRSFCLSIISVFEIQRGLSDNCVRRAKQHGGIATRRLSTTIYTNNTIVRTRRTNKIPRTCNSYRNVVWETQVIITSVISVPAGTSNNYINQCILRNHIALSYPLSYFIYFNDAGAIWRLPNCESPQGYI